MAGQLHKAAFFASPLRFPHRQKICVLTSLAPALQQRLRMAAKLDRWGMVRGIDNIGICAIDLFRSVAFYETLGFSEAYRNDRGIMMAAGTVQLFLFATQHADAMPVGRNLGLFGNPPGIDHLSFTVSDVDALYRKLRATGVAIDDAPEDQSWGARMVGLRDPDGNNLYLLQRF